MERFTHKSGLTWLFLALAALFAGSSFAQASTTYTSQTSNNTSACPSSGPLPAGCVGSFGGLVDHWAQQDTGNPYTPPGPPRTQAASQTQTKTTVPPPGNISKISLKTLLYPGYGGAITTKIACHVQLWFGGTRHISNGQNMNDSTSVQVGSTTVTGATVDRQITDMISRGCDYAVFDWYGPNPNDAFNDPVSLKFRDNLDARCQVAAAQGQPCPLKMAMMDDHGTASGANTQPGMNTDLQYILSTYSNHPSYWTITDASGCANRGVIFFFGWGSGWNWANAKDYIHNGLGLNCTNEPVLVVEGEAGIDPSNPQYGTLDGGYGWVGVDAYYSSSYALVSASDDANTANGNPGSPTTVGVSGTGQFNPHFLPNNSFSVDHFYSQAVAHSSNDSRLVVGAAYAGFNDTNAGWGFSSSDGHPNGRKVARQCGQVWLNAWKRLTANGSYSGTKQISVVGIPTWNDYEEDSAIEPGIDNCASISDDAISGTTYTFHIGFTDSYGTEDTIDHYEVYYSTDGQTGEQLNLLTTVAVNKSNGGTYRVTLPTTLPNPTIIYAKAVGVPVVQNHMTLKPGRAYVPPSSCALNAAPGSLTFASQPQNSTSAPQPVSLGTSNCSGAVNISGIQTSSNFAQSSNCPASLSPGANCTVNVTFTPNAAGSFSGALVIGNDSSGNPQTRVSLSGTGTAAAANAALSPSTLDLGLVSSGSTSPARNLTLTNSGPGPLSISSVSVTNSQFGLSNGCGSNLAAGASCTIGVTFTPTTYGTQADVVTVSGSKTVTADIEGTSLNSSQVLYSNIQNNPAWTTCATVSCAGGNGGASGTFTPNQSSPALNGNSSAQFSIGGPTAYANVRFKDSLPAQDSVTQLRLDMDLYIQDPELPQNLIFGVGQAVSNVYYPFQIMCDLKGTQTWQIWNVTQGAWVTTSVSCTPSALHAGDWTHLSFVVQRTSGNQMKYVSIGVDGNSYVINSALYNPTVESPDAVEVLFLEGGDSHQDPYSIVLDNVTLSTP